MRIVVWLFRALIALVVLRMVMRVFGRARTPRRASSPGQGKPQERLGGTLVRCATCGTHVPRDRARAGGGDVHYCSGECQERAPAHGAPAHPRT